LLDDGDASASVAVFVDGEPVMDVWGGFADTDRTISWQRNTITNARSVALVQSVMACGGAVRGVRLLSQVGCHRAREEQFSGEDRLLGMPVRYGPGYGLGLRA
jgi:hypothetical protein